MSNNIEILNGDIPFDEIEWMVKNLKQNPGLDDIQSEVLQTVNMTFILWHLI